MSASGLYKNRELVDEAVKQVSAVIQPGDVINQCCAKHKWWEIWKTIPAMAICWHQKKLFGKKSNWKDTHTMLYFDLTNTFSVELPKATLKPLQEFCLSNMSIYRLKLKSLTTDDISIMWKTAHSLLGEKYDVGQLLDIAINDLLGFDNQRPLIIFDAGRKNKVCSVGVRAIFESLYQRAIRTANSKQGKWLFYEMNPEKWPAKKVREYRGTDVEATSPAHFANSDCFCFDFELIARFNEGKRIDLVNTT